MAWLWVAGMRGAEEELEAQRGELGEFRRKVEGERKNYKRLLKAQEAKMREQEKARAVRSLTLQSSLGTLLVSDAPASVTQ